MNVTLNTETLKNLKNNSFSLNTMHRHIRIGKRHKFNIYNMYIGDMTSIKDMETT